MHNKSLLAMLLTSVCILTLACDSEDLDAHIDDLEYPPLEGEELTLEADLLLDGNEVVSMFADELDSPSNTTPVIGGTHKVCSVIRNGMWRDTVVVPQGWSPTDCYDLNLATGTTHAQLACFTDSGFVFGPASTYVPAPPSYNPCGW